MARGRWALDSGAFSELSAYGRWTLTLEQYVAAVRRYRDEVGQLDWAAPQDRMFTHPPDTCRNRGRLPHRGYRLWAAIGICPVTVAKGMRWSSQRVAAFPSVAAPQCAADRRIFMGFGVCRWMVDSVQIVLFGVACGVGTDVVSQEPLTFLHALRDV